MEWSAYLIFALIFAGVFFTIAAFALHWAVKNGQMSNLDQGARVIFEDEEPEGMQTDYFPDKNKRKKSSIPSTEEKSIR